MGMIFIVEHAEIYFIYCFNIMHFFVQLFIFCTTVTYGCFLGKPFFSLLYKWHYSNKDQIRIPIFQLSYSRFIAGPNSQVIS